MGSLDQGRKTEKVHCLPCLISDFKFVLLCHYNTEKVLLCLGHLGKKVCVGGWGAVHAMIHWEDGHTEG